MKPHSRRYPKAVPAVVLCRAALQRGPLRYERHGRGEFWRFGRRMFSSPTVNALLHAGVAVRDGNIVRAA